jgi:hypothetical protein
MFWDVPIEGVGWESMLDVIFERERNESVSAGLSLSLSSSKIDRRGSPWEESKGFDIGLESQSQMNEFEGILLKRRRLCERTKCQDSLSSSLPFFPFVTAK